LAVQQSEVKRRETMATLRRSEATGLRIRAGVAGVLQEVPVQVGQRIGPGTNLGARRRPDAVESAAADRRDAGQGCRDRAEAQKSTPAARVREDASCDRSRRPQRHGDGGLSRSTARCRVARGPT
jgi:HlyD family secretion protein